MKKEEIEEEETKEKTTLYLELELKGNLAGMKIMDKDRNQIDWKDCSTTDQIRIVDNLHQMSEFFKMFIIEDNL